MLSLRRTQWIIAIAPPVPHEFVLEGVLSSVTRNVLALQFAARVDRVFRLTARRDGRATLLHGTPPPSARATQTNSDDTTPAPCSSNRS